MASKAESTVGSAERAAITGLSFTLSNNCNLKCSFCPRTRYGVRSKKIAPSALEAVVAQSHTLDRVQILGLGEPLANSNFAAAVRRLKEAGVQLSFTTNGLLLTQEISDQLCLRQVDEVIFSLQGAKPSTHEKGKASNLTTLLDAVQGIVTAKRQTRSNLPRLSFNFVGLTSNIDELPHVVELADRTGVDNVYVSNLVPFDRQTAHFHLHREPALAASFMDRARERAERLGVELTVYASLAPSPMECRWSTRPHIGLDGDVYPCNFIGAQDNLAAAETIWYENAEIRIEVGRFRLGNVKDQSIEQIWNGRKAERLRQAQSLSLERDRAQDWDRTRYRDIIRRLSDAPLPEEVCMICPHRFKITH